MIKLLTCLFLLLIPSCGFFICFNGFCVVRASADTDGISDPVVPEFTLKFVEESYEVPTTYSIDPFTGKNKTHEGHTVTKRSIETSIKNNLGVSYYNFRFKGHYEDK